MKGGQFVGFHNGNTLATAVDPLAPDSIDTRTGEGLFEERNQWGIGDEVEATYILALFDLHNELFRQRYS